MTTAYQTATAGARNAGRLFLTHAIVCPGFSCPADLPRLGLYECPKTGLAIVLTRSGAVDSAATKARREAKAQEAATAADIAGRAMARRNRLQEEAAAIDSQWPAADLPQGFCADLEEAPAAKAPAFVFALRFAPALESPLFPFSTEARQAVAAYGRGAF